MCGFTVFPSHAHNLIYLFIYNAMGAFWWILLPLVSKLCVTKLNGGRLWEQSDCSAVPLGNFRKMAT